MFFRLQWAWDLGYWAFARFAPSRAATQRLMTRVGGRGLLRLIAEVDPDVIVSTYPNTMEVLARLRRTGRIRVPVCSAITDLAGMHYWAPPGADLYLITHPESAGEVRNVAGPQARVFCVHGLTAPEFLVRPDAATVRADLGLPAAGKVVLVSGGGWGVGDLEGAVEEALSVRVVASVVCLCGRNERVRAELSRRFAGHERVRVEGFTERMRDWLAAADVLIHSTGGLTVLEALMQGCPPISYGWGRGHLRVNNAAYRFFGLADVVAERNDLGPAIVRAFERPRQAATAFRGLPSAASVILAEVQPDTP